MLNPQRGDGIVIGASNADQLLQNIRALREARLPRLCGMAKLGRSARLTRLSTLGSTAYWKELTDDLMIDNKRFLDVLLKCGVEFLLEYQTRT